MSEPIKRTILQSELDDWKRKISEVMPPQVAYIDDGELEMLREAYNKRGDVLYDLHHWFVNNSHPTQS